MTMLRLTLMATTAITLLTSAASVSAEERTCELIPNTNAYQCSAQDTLSGGMGTDVLFGGWDNDHLNGAEDDTSGADEAPEADKGLPDVSKPDVDKCVPDLTDKK